MDWKELGTEIAKLGLPLLGAALPIPGGAGIGAALAATIGAKDAKPENILAELTSNADAVVKAKQFEMQHQERMLDLTQKHELSMRQADSSDIESVNQTIREEIKNASDEEWYQKGWRPYNGFMFGTTLFCNYALPSIMNTLAPVLTEGHKWTAVVSQPIPEFVFIAWGSVLGVTAWHRGVKQRIAAGDTDSLAAKIISKVSSVVKKKPTDEKDKDTGDK